MPATTELTVIDSFLYSILAADATLVALIGSATPRIYADINPQIDEQASPIAAAYPCVVWQLQSARPDLMAVGAIRIWSSGLYLVRGIVETRSYGGTLETIATRIDALLHDVRGSVSGGTVISSVRQQPFRQAEFTNGRHFRHLGGMYSIQAQVT